MGINIPSIFLSLGIITPFGIGYSVDLLVSIAHPNL
jgi:hypothetical protein